ncbi:hypothetical protein SDC9_204187 [bioreactor metagenome]|uniref:Uncharacterized protein n=1 Tax=bioreactor metagenome TaxID=1076179 RepID=A0A645IZA2_9ZZZZ
MAVQIHESRQDHPAEDLQGKLEPPDGSQEPLETDRFGRRGIHAEKAVCVEQPPPVAGQRVEGRIGLEVVPAEVEQVRLEHGGNLPQVFKPPGGSIGRRGSYSPGGQAGDGPVNPHTFNCR